MLTGEVPAEFATLWDLSDLYIENNRLSGAIPALLGDLGLRTLYLAGNQFTGCIPAALAGVSGDVATLGLSYCAADSTHTLTTSATGVGSIHPSPGTHSYRSGALVRVVATQFALFRVASWGGDCSANGRATECILTMDANKTASVTFERGAPVTTYTLTTSSGANGGISPAAGMHGYDEDTAVTVTAAPDAGYRVASWGGDCTASGTATTCALTMDADKTASVTFERTTHTLTTWAGANGSISPAAGEHNYDEDASVTITATPDTGYRVDSWGGDCSGAATTCALTMDDDRAARVAFAPSGPVCTTATDATCIRAVYRGAPDDYAQVADIPADVLIAPRADGRYRVARGEQVTVVTAATVPTGYTRFYLQRSPLEFGTPSPVSFSQLIPPVGTTYTFTPTLDEAGATLITFDLTAARPHPLQRPGLKPQLGDVVVTTTFKIATSLPPGGLAAVLTPDTYQFPAISAPAPTIVNIPASSYEFVWSTTMIDSAGVYICLAEVTTDSSLCLSVATGQESHRHVAAGTDSVPISELFDEIAASSRLRTAP